MNNPVWMMSSAYPEKNLNQLIEIARRIGLQGIELCVFRTDGLRSDHVATHLDYAQFDTETAKKTIELFNRDRLRFSIGAFENLIGGDPAERVHNQNHLLRLIRMAAMMGGDANGITVGTFVGYNHEWDLEARSFEKNLLEYKRIFSPIIRYAEDLGVTVVYENCPMEGWRSADYSSTMNNLPSTLAARKLMYELIPSKSHGETYDPSHDVWQFVNPVDVLKHSDLNRIKSVHLKATRLRQDSSAVHWGHVYGKQVVDAELAHAAGVPIAEHEWDRFPYEAMVPGFGGTDSMDWRAFIDYLNEHDFDGVFSIENEGANSKGTDNDAAIEQGFSACLSFVRPMIWPLHKDDGYSLPKQKELILPDSKAYPAVEMKDLTA
jgi:sugar phosphate isomerase/epimerase